LVVEDEFLINALISHDLRSAGYDVVSAFNADEAIEILEHRTDIQLAFTDIDMPSSMDGLSLLLPCGTGGRQSTSLFRLERLDPGVTSCRRTRVLFRSHGAFQTSLARPQLWELANLNVCQSWTSNARADRA